LGELVNQNGEKLFKEGEVSHMADVKTVMLSAFGAGALMIIIGIIAMLYLRKRSTGGIRRGMFAGSIVTLVLILGLGTLAALGWQQFFTDFHHIFFANGTWTFALDDTLIRLFPGQYLDGLRDCDRCIGLHHGPADTHLHLAYPPSSRTCTQEPSRCGTQRGCGPGGPRGSRHAGEVAPPQQRGKRSAWESPIPGGPLRSCGGV
jgi:hypothetical protein